MFSNPFVYPSSSLIGSLFNGLANSRALARIRRAIFSKLPFPTLASDVVDVVYLNWVVPTPLVRHLVPNGLGLRDFNGQTILTALTYRHGHFGPSLAGSLRRCFPSPLQSNWRLYVAQMPKGQREQGVVLFIKNVFDSRLYAVGTRLFSDGLPSHFAPRFTHQRTAHGYRTTIDGGAGSAPSLSADVDVSTAKELPHAFQPLFTSWQGAVQYLTQQESALSEVAGLDQLAHAGIALPIAVDTVLPARARSVALGQFLQACGASTQPFCFVVPAVHFKVLWERLL